MRISIGILAHNESCTVGKTILSLASQSLLQRDCAGVEAIQVVCVPNGCSDDTASVARESLARLLTEVENPLLSTGVHELERAGKPRSWNAFVHEQSDPAATHLILLDADIDLTSPDALEALVQVLRDNPQGYASVGVPIKRRTDRFPFFLFEKMSRGASSLTQAGTVGLNGGLYCARAEKLRQIWLPNELLVEDGFIKAMLITDFFKRQDAPPRLLRAKAARYEIDAYLHPLALFRHERRLIVGTALNALAYTELWGLPPETDVSDYVRERVVDEEPWLWRLLAAHADGRGWWLMPEGSFRAVLFKRFRGLKQMGRASALRALPAALLSVAFELPVILGANRELRKGRLDW
jgi:hypothetical protein